MSQNLFLSYSRQQTPFIERLAADLEKAGHSLWLDYRSLVPAKPWYDQIKAGVSGAEAFLLVVSKGSVSSTNVEPEWRLALELKERIILLIFEAAPLPPELQNCEWVDFRTNFKKSFAELKNKLDAQPAVPALPASQSGVKVPKRFWLAFALWAVLIITSLPTWWTILVPFLLIPLPWQIFKRNYMYSRIMPLLSILPFILYFTWYQYSVPGSINDFIGVFAREWGWLAAFASWSLLGLFMSPGMQLRMRPEAARVRFANPLVPEKQKPRSVLFAIDHAPEDGRYAEYMTRRLQKHGHRLAGPDEKPEAVFVLLSTYKRSTQYDPEQQSVFPVLLQAVGEIDENLQKIQWIDFRRGTKDIDKVALLLPEPEKMLKALAVAPTGLQEIMPLGVNVLLYYYLLVGMLGIGGLLFDSWDFYTLWTTGYLPPEYLSAERFIFVAINAVALFVLVVNMVKAVRSRSVGAASFYSVFVTMVLLYFVLGYNTSMTVYINPGINIYLTGGFSSWIIAYAVEVSILFVLFLLFRWRELYNWFPRRQDQSRLNSFERFLLLYTPQRIWVLVLHVLFHLGVFWLYILLAESARGMDLTSLVDSPDTAVVVTVWIIILCCPGILVIGFPFLARLLEKKK